MQGIVSLVVFTTVVYLLSAQKQGRPDSIALLLLLGPVFSPAWVRSGRPVPKAPQMYGFASMVGSNTDSKCLQNEPSTHADTLLFEHALCHVICGGGFAGRYHNFWWSLGLVQTGACRKLPSITEKKLLRPVFATMHVCIYNDSSGLKQ